MEVDHDLVVVDEFDALSIEVKVPAETQPATAPKNAPKSAPAPILAAVKEKPLGKFPAKTHARKVANELAVDNGLVYLPGRPTEIFEDSDMGPEFRQRRYFYYLSGADFANCAVTYDIARDHLILWIPYSDPRQLLWFGTTPTIEDCKSRYAVDDVRIIGGLERFLYLHLTPSTTLYCLHADQIPKLTGPATSAGANAKWRGAVHVDTAKLRPAIDAARVVKTDYEVAMIRRANAVSSAAHRAVLERVASLTNEREIEAIFRGFCTAKGAKHQAYPVIAGAGPNAAALHYFDNTAPLAGKHQVVLDAGAEWNCYASDVTRTFPVTGKWTTEGGQIYRIVERMQNECIARIRPGLIFYTLHLHASIVAIEELLKLGILQGGTPAEIFARGTISAFFPHGLGHHVGLEVHDVSGYEKLMLSAKVPETPTTATPTGVTRAAFRGKRELVTPEMLIAMYRDAVSAPPPYKGRQKLAKNMIVTVEPGLYFCREYIEAYFLDNELHAKYINKDLLEKYYPIGGVRIEDCVLVTAGGHENLTTAPKGDAALKVINGE